MKSKILFSFYGIVLSFISSAQHIGDYWTQQSAGVFNTLEDVDFYDNNFGCAVGVWGHIAVTSNGGQTWEHKGFNNTSLYAVQQVTKNNIYVAVNFDIFFSDDQGDNWINQTSSMASNSLITDIFFLDSLRGWAVGNNNGIIRTIDGGNQWEELSSGLPSGETFWFISVFFTTEQNGWIVGENGLVLKTNNSGDSWEKIDVSPSYFHKVYFQNSMRGWILGAYNTILRTTNGGESWQAVDVTVQSGSFLDISFSSDEIGWIVGGDKTLFKTNNSGETWVKIQGAPNSLFAINFPTNGVGYMVGGNFGSVSPPVGGIWKYNTELSTFEDAFNDISFYPNPASDFIHVELPESDVYQRIEVFDIQGKFIESYVVTGSQMHIDVSNLEPNLYFISFKNRVVKFVKI